MAKKRICVSDTSTHSNYIQTGQKEPFVKDGKSKTMAVQVVEAYRVVIY
jgi:hypothetical protein